MARIFVSYYKLQETNIRVMQAFWDGFVHDLEACGNEVLVINTAYFNTYDSNRVRSPRINKMILGKVKDFDPELIIAFNHRIPLCVLEEFTEVPTIIWDGDSPSFMCDWPYVLNHMDRYTVLTISKEWEKEYIEKGIPAEKVHYIPVATSVRKADVPQDKNVSFVGARAYYNQRMIKNLKAHKALKASKGIVEEFLKTSNFDYKNYSEKYFPGYNVTAEQLHPFFDFRWLTLANMLDLGLTICGHSSRWEATAEYMPQLMACYDTTRVWTNKENEDFFNSSKVSLCPIHPQAGGDAFSWRVFDIMASNACLLVSESSQLRELLKDYVELPMYKDPWDAREKCKELLENDEKRQKIVEACQRYVEENARWELRFKKIEQYIGIKLVDKKNEGSLKDLYLEDSDMIALRSDIRSEKIKTKSASQKQQKTKPYENKYMLMKDSLFFSFILVIFGALLMQSKSGLTILKDFFVSMGVAANTVSIIGQVLCIAGLIGCLSVFVYLFNFARKKVFHH